MLRNIGLRNFKACKDVEIPMSGISLLAGLNSSGKSSVIQSLGLLCQSYWGRVSAPVWVGSITQLGSFREVLSDSATDDVIKISIEDDQGAYEFVFGANGRIEQTRGNELPTFLRERRIQFIHANRIVPQSLYPKRTVGTFEGIGARGEFSASVLAGNGEDVIRVQGTRLCDYQAVEAPIELLNKAAPTNNLVDQVSGWMQAISPGVRVSAKEIEGAEEAQLQFGNVGRVGVHETSLLQRPTNVGFGLTYGLPVVISCLSASSGDILALENPEAHLHPRGQMALGELVARTVVDGVQVIVETHSDHFLNGVRLAVKRGVLAPEMVSCSFFTKSVEDGSTYTQHPMLTDKGRLSDWPEGFFDQWDLAVGLLLK